MNLNARLPLPKSKNEEIPFLMKIGSFGLFYTTSGWYHTDLRRPNRTDYRTKWITADDRMIGDRFVRVIGF